MTHFIHTTHSDDGSPKELPKHVIDAGVRVLGEGTYGRFTTVQLRDLVVKVHQAMIEALE